MQLAISIVYYFSLYSFISLFFSITYISTKYFNFSYAAYITFGAYLTFLLTNQINFELLFAIPLAIIITIAISLFFEFTTFQILRKRNSSSLILLLSSIGVYIVLQNLISLGWGDSTISIRADNSTIGHEFFGAYINNIQLTSIIVCLLLFVITIIFLNNSSLGRKFRAISSNNELATIFGINLEVVILIAVSIGTGLAAITGILVAYDSDMTPTMGFNLLLYGIVAMIIGGVGSNWGLLGGAFLLAVAQHLGAYYIDSKWMDAIAYIILILFLIWRPLGFSGKRLKKIEI